MSFCGSVLLLRRAGGRCITVRAFFSLGKHLKKSARIVRSRGPLFLQSISDRYRATGSPNVQQQQDQQQPFDQVYFGDAAEALGRSGAGSSSADSGTGVGSALGTVPLPINFKELLVLTRRGNMNIERLIVCMCAHARGSRAPLLFTMTPLFSANCCTDSRHVKN